MKDCKYRTTALCTAPSGKALSGVFSTTATSFKRYEDLLERQRRRQQVWTEACAAVDTGSLRCVEKDVLKRDLQ